MASHLAQRRVDDWLRTHHAVVTRQQARALGLSAARIDGHLAARRWQALHRGVYASASSPLTAEARLSAAILAAGHGDDGGARASFRSAAWLHGVIDDPPSPCVTIAHGRHLGHTGFEVHQCRSPAPPTHPRGIPATSLSRTMCDLATVVGAAEMKELVDRCFARRLTKPADLVRRLQHQPRQPGARRLLDHLVERGIVDGVAPTRPELTLLDHLRAAGLPAPVREHPVWVEGVERRLDTAYPDRMLTFEVDGHEHHSSPQQISADHDRREALRSLGWDVAVFTRNDVVRDGARVRRRATAAYDRAGRRATMAP